MIIDQLKNVSWYFGMNEKLTRALQYLQNTDLSGIGQGKYEIDGFDGYAIVQQYETRPKEKGLWEAHRRYIDIQYVVSGTELIGYANLNHMKAGDYDEVKDLLPFQGDGDFFVVREGTFVILTPQDAHMPGIAVSTPQLVKKVVLKVCVTTRNRYSSR